MKAFGKANLKDHYGLLTFKNNCLSVEAKTSASMNKGTAGSQ